MLYLEGEKNASPHTQTSYRIALEAFRAFRPGLSWKDATVDDFRAFLFDLMKSGRADPVSDWHSRHCAAL
jgi:site-specific recombinase XerD